MRRPVGVKLVLRGFCWSLVLPSRAATVATLPSALSVSDLRSVQVGRSRFSRCCHLLSDLASIFRWRFGPGDCRSHRNSALGFVFPVYLTYLRCCRQQRLTAVAERLVDLAAHPQSMQQDGQLPRHRHYRSFLRILASALGQPQTPAPQITVGSKRPQNVLRFAPSSFLDRDLLPC